MKWTWAAALALVLAGGAQAAEDPYVDPAARLGEVDAALAGAASAEVPVLQAERATLLTQLDRLAEAEAAIAAGEAALAASGGEAARAELLIARANVHTQRQQHAEADPLAREARALRVAAFGEGSAEVALADTFIGGNLVSLSRLEEGLAFTRAGWDVLRELRAPGDSDRYEAGLQYAVGLLYARRAEQSEAQLRLLLEELPALPAGHVMRAKLPHFLGVELLMQGRTNEALAYLDQSQRAAQDSKSLILGERADFLATFGIALLNQDRPEEALPVLLESAELFGQADAIPSQAGSLLTGGTAADRAGDRAMGLALRERGMALLGAEENQHPLAIALNRFKLAQSYAHMGQLEKAEAMEAQAVESFAEFRPVDHFQAVNSRIGLGWIKALRGDTAGGMALVKPAFRMSVATGERLELAQGRVLSVLADVEAYSQALETARLAGDMEFAWEIMQVMVDSDASRAALAVTAREAAADSALGTLLKRRQEAAAALAAADSALLKAKTVEDGVAEAQVAFDTAESALAALDTELDAAFPTFRDLLRPRRTTLAETRAALAPDEALLVVVEGDIALATMAVTADGQVLGTAPLRRPDVRRLVGAVRQSIDARLLGDESAAFATGVAGELYRAIFTPEVAALVSGKRALRFATGDILSALPPSLLVGGDGRYLIEDHAISVVPSIAALAARPGEPSGLAKLIAIGAPALAGGRSLAAGPDYYAAGETRAARVAQLNPLPAAEAEMRRVAALLGGEGRATILSGAQASEPRVKALDFSGADVVLFATHGLVAGSFDANSEPALVLTPPREQSEEDDGLLTASEAALLDIDADWVILSACDTAAGGRPSAAGYTGLARGFLFAGARRVVASHWPVRDDISAGLSAGIVEASRDGADAGEALRWAVLAVKAEHPEPALWAPFMVVGR